MRIIQEVLNPMISSELVICWIYDVFVDTHTHTHMDLVVLTLVMVTTDAFFDALFFRVDHCKFWFLSSDLYMMETNIAGRKRKTNNK